MYQWGNCWSKPCPNKIKQPCDKVCSHHQDFRDFSYSTLGRNKKTVNTALYKQNSNIQGHAGLYKQFRILNN